jgi:hypothetical protein
MCALNEIDESLSHSEYSMTELTPQRYQVCHSVNICNSELIVDSEPVVHFKNISLVAYKCVYKNMFLNLQNQLTRKPLRIQKNQIFIRMA